MRIHSVFPLLAFLALTTTVRGAELPLVTDVERQPLAAQAKRIVAALDYLGNPLSDSEKKTLLGAATDADNKKAVAAIQKTLDPHCLAAVRIESEKKLEAIAGPAKPMLAEQGWRLFLVKVYNPKGIDRVELRPFSPNSRLPYQRATNKPDPKVTSLGGVKERFLELQSYNSQPLVRNLSGLELEYRILQVYCRDGGRREAKLGFGLWRNPRQGISASKLIDVLVEAEPAVVVKLSVKDFDGKPVMASFVFRDQQGRVYPAQTRRLAPDFFFHAQIYRKDGETVLLQPGKYTVECTRGPEYLVKTRTITVPEKPSHAEAFKLERWVHPKTSGWYSGDHHIHAAGCAHYDSPTEGVTPEDMMRHVLGEDVNVGCCLSWGPCWYHQKRYFDGKSHPLSTDTHLLRYDVEVSGFPSSHAGHLCLLRLREQDYPGTKLISDWPSWDLPILKWGKMQGGVVGFAHSGWGLDLGPTKELPTYKVPAFNSIGANEYVMDVTHGVVDFISTVDTPPVWELNVWYHTLNCGYRARISGETDFPCIFGQRVGIGRSYVHLDGKLNFNDWAEGVKQGRCYVSDGKSHLMDFSVNGLGVGLKKSEIQLKQPEKIKIKAKIAARLEPKPTPETERIRNTPLHQKPYWDVERARIGKTRKVPVEVIVNGYPVAKKEIVADGSLQDVSFDVPIEHSSWVCLRIFPTSHTNPIFVTVVDKPIRASKRSAAWCLKAVDQCEKQKMPKIRKEEQEAAKKAYEHARREYRKILKECVGE